MSNRPSVYISYAHTDGMEFVRRLAFALNLYVDVYWDRRVQTGEYPSQLRAEIARCDYFLLVTTPYSLASEWCKQELAHAHTHGKPIALAHIYGGEGAADPELDRKYTYGDFTENFEHGFRALTTMILGQPYSSWESFSGAPTPVLLNYLKAGVIPCVVAKEVGEWVLVNKLWGAITAELGAKRTAKLFFSTPLTATGILTQCKAVAEQLEKLKDKRNGDLFKQIIAIAENCVTNLMPLADNQHMAAGQIAYDVIMQTKSMIEIKQMEDRDFDKLHVTKTFFEFDAAEKIRAAITEQVRRSRAIY